LDNDNVKEVKLISQAIVEAAPMGLNDRCGDITLRKSTALKKASGNSLNLNNKGHSVSCVIHCNPHAYPALYQGHFINLFIHMHSCKVSTNTSLDFGGACVLVYDINSCDVPSGESLDGDDGVEGIFEPLSG
jgi:hypothetical protein